MSKLTLSKKKNLFLLRYDNIISWRTHNNVNRKMLWYSLFFFLMYKDYFIHKIINKIMCDGKKEQSFFIFRTSLFYLKVFLGYQPFFLFKHVAFRMRQLFTIQTKLIRKTKLYSMPLLLTPKNQITYGINHLLKCSRLLSLDEKITFSQSLYLVLLNCFIRNIKHKKFPK